MRRYVEEEKGKMRGDDYKEVEGQDKGNNSGDEIRSIEEKQEIDGTKY